ncbi:MAG: 4-hydroxy-tetrahydrodipicolinate synthase [Planctomycetes bacterium]|nr:4-hydroxy-tetrahydrodipicolinate synthase [Planctomycetota bacterium]
MKALKLPGCWTALITPFTADASQVDLPRLKEQIRAQSEGGVAGVVPCGTTGEAPTLTPDEHRQVVEAAVAAAKPLGLQVMAGAGSNSTASAVKLQKLVASLGADASLHVAPYYNKPNQEGIYQHFMMVADAADLPVVLYSIPGRCGVAILPETVERLSRHPNIAAIKEATGSVESAREIRRRCSLPILSGDDILTLDFAQAGAIGVVSVVSNILPAAVRSLIDACLAKDFIQARTLHEAMLPLSRGLLALDTNPIPVKAAMQLLGRDSGALRLPLVKAAAPALKSIAALLKEAGLPSGRRDGATPAELIR